jgi:hypothetical protein
MFESKQSGLTSSKTVVTTTSVSTIDVTPETINSNRQRSGINIVNTSDKDIYILVGSGTPSLSNLTLILPAYSGSGGILIYETPFGYSGEINILASSGAGTGNVIITEYNY